MITRLGDMSLGGQGCEGESPREFCERGSGLYHHYVKRCQERGLTVALSTCAAVSIILHKLETILTPERAGFIRHNARGLRFDQYTFGWLQGQVAFQIERRNEDMEEERDQE